MMTDRCFAAALYPLRFFQVSVDGKGQPTLCEMTAAGVSYEPVGKVEGLAKDAMRQGGMRDLATVGQCTFAFMLNFFVGCGVTHARGHEFLSLTLSSALQDTPQRDCRRRLFLLLSLCLRALLG